MGFTSTAIQDRAVFAQATEPDFERDGVLWVDTSTATRELRVYSEESERWESVDPDNTLDRLRMSEGFAPEFYG